MHRAPTWLRLIPLGLAVLLMGAGGGARPPLVDAARNGDRDALRALLQEKVDVNAAEADGTTALHWARYRDDAESADLLIRAGANVNAATDLGVTPLWTASQNGNASLVRSLLEAGANPNAALLRGETPLMVAARSGYPEVVEQLLAKGANVNARAARGQTALMWAVSQKHPDVVKVLLAHGADVQARSEVWSEMMAVPPHGYPGYNKMIPHGGDTRADVCGARGRSRLGEAPGGRRRQRQRCGCVGRQRHGAGRAFRLYRELVEFLLEQGADPNKAEAGFTALHVAILRRDEKMVSALLDHGADPNTPLRTWTPTRRSSHDFHFPPALVGATPFWLAARFSEPGVMRLLVQHGADPLFVHHSDYVGGEGFQHRTEVTTALMAATGMGGGAAWVQPASGERESLTLEAAKLAVELGVDVNAANTDGRTALDAAKSLGYDSVVQFLVEAGAK